jgi:hypothetical protein
MKVFTNISVLLEQIHKVKLSYKKCQAKTLIIMHKLKKTIKGLKGKIAMRKLLKIIRLNPLRTIEEQSESRYQTWNKFFRNIKS